jgi:hypothetical protein
LLASFDNCRADEGQPQMFSYARLARLAAAAEFMLGDVTFILSSGIDSSQINSVNLKSDSALAYISHQSLL